MRWRSKHSGDRSGEIHVQARLGEFLVTAYSVNSTPVSFCAEIEVYDSRNQLSQIWRVGGYESLDEAQGYALNHLRTLLTDTLEDMDSPPKKDVKK